MFESKVPKIFIKIVQSGAGWLFSCINNMYFLILRPMIFLPPKTDHTTTKSTYKPHTTYKIASICGMFTKQKYFPQNPIAIKNNKAGLPSGPLLGSIIGGRVYSYIRVLSGRFLLKPIIFMVCDNEYMDIHPPPNYRV